MIAVLSLSSDTLLIIAYAAVNSRGDNEARAHVSAELWKGNAFLFCTAGPYLYVCRHLDSRNDVLLVSTEPRGETCGAVEMCNFIKVIEY